MVFSPTDNTVALLNNELHIVKLSNQASRLLLELIINHNKTLARQDLLKTVWADFGFTPSNNTLNVAISEIRKVFSSLGKDPCILITIPKIGFSLDADIEPTLNNERSESEKSPLTAKKKPTICIQY